ncbi:hypothetical protein [Falsirhodobacter xinxiangensis]|uniref:hypothetical protein n=1 Tax=Falsirhodobacter xinxiangensis TaxID=2530049 RepID=UPI0010AB4844|nr:hypothetical protein [Rhodobacter xinxiangensis]
MTKEIDQRQQRHDPASKHTEGLNKRPDSQTKQPGRIDEVEGSPDQIAAADAGRTKFNTRDDGHGKVTTDDPLDHIADANDRED